MEDPERPPSRGRKAASKPILGSATSPTPQPTVPVTLAPPSSEASAEIPLTLDSDESPGPTASSTQGDRDAGSSVKETPDIPSAPETEQDAPLKVKLVERTTAVFGERPPPPASFERKALAAGQPSQNLGQISAQEYPWLYMSSTLEALLQGSTSSKEEVKAHAPQATSEATPEAEPTSRSVDDSRKASELPIFSGEKSPDKLIETAPAVMRAFHVHDEMCTRVEAEALQLALNVPEIKEDTDEAEVMQTYRDTLEQLEHLHAEALELESSILEFTKTEPSPETNPAEPSARSQIVGMVAACLPVIQARITNLRMAQELTDSALENLSISFRMESLGIE